MSSSIYMTMKCKIETVSMNAVTRKSMSAYPVGSTYVRMQLNRELICRAIDLIGVSLMEEAKIFEGVDELVSTNVVWETVEPKTAVWYWHGKAIIVSNEIREMMANKGEGMIECMAVVRVDASYERGFRIILISAIEI